MLAEAENQIDGCRSLEILRETWAANVKRWSENFPRPDMEKLIHLKDQKKAVMEHARGRYSFKMDSGVLGRVVGVKIDTHKPDRAVVDGVEYSKAEMRDLKGRGLTQDRLVEIHKVKGAFEGWVLNKVAIVSNDTKSGKVKRVFEGQVLNKGNFGHGGRGV